MPTQQSVTLVKGSIPDDTCFGSVSELYNTIINTTTAYVNGNYSLFNFGDTEPSASDRDKPWVRTISGQPDRIYVYENGWISKHNTPAGGSERRIWVGTESDLETYDGGGTGTVSSITGPMWEVDPSFAAAFPVGMGSFTGGTIVNDSNKTGGADEVTLTEAQLPAHSHPFTLNGYNSSQDGNSGNEYGFDGTSAQSLTTDDSGGGNAHNNLPPYYGVYFIKRTGRIYYTA